MLPPGPVEIGTRISGSIGRSRWCRNGWSSKSLSSLGWPREPFRPVGKLSPYCEAAARNAYKRIVEAPAGQQETTLNSEAFGLARLVVGWGMPPSLALDVLQKAAQKMPSYDRRRPWRQRELDRKVTDAFAAACGARGRLAMDDAAPELDELIAPTRQEAAVATSGRRSSRTKPWH
jgi:hypothetical protein